MTCRPRRFPFRATRCFGLVAGIILAGLPDSGAEPPVPTAFQAEAVTLSGGRSVRIGERAGEWTLMAVLADAGPPAAVFEDFTSDVGALAVVDGSGAIRQYAKSSEPTWAESGSVYRGHTLEQIRASEHDLLGRELLAGDEDPSYAAVAACLPPITRMETYSFIGTPLNSDKVGVAYGGRTAAFDPAVYVPAIRPIREAGRVRDGLVGGWLPILRFVFPEADDAWTELVLFAPFRVDEGNHHVQPVWYRLCRVERGALQWAKYFDSGHPFPPRRGAPPAGFYREMQACRVAWETALAPLAGLELPDRRLANLVRHSLVRAMITRLGDFPKYGVLDRNYGGAEHDGFQDTFNVELATMTAWGLFARAQAVARNYLDHFVRPDGSILYRGPETGQYGRMLTVLAGYARATGDVDLLLNHREKIDAVARLLLDLRRAAQQRAPDDPAHGMIAGWCEADSCLDPQPERYQQPYFSNSCEAERGWREIGAVWERAGRERRQEELAAWGRELQREAAELHGDLLVALQRSRLPAEKPACVPAVAGAAEPPYVAAARDGTDPQFRAYRAYMEMLHSGVLPPDDAEAVMASREAHHDIVLGIPTAYGYNSGELAGFLSYGHAFGLLQRDHVREYLLCLYGLEAHQYTRGLWTAPETRQLNPTVPAAPYCVPAQLAVPLLVRDLLVFEDPADGTLWLAKALPRAWLKDGEVVAVERVPTSRGPVSFRVHSRLAESRIDATVTLPMGPDAGPVLLRLRLPEGRVLRAVTVRGKSWEQFDPAEGTIRLPSTGADPIEIIAHVR